VCKLLGVMLAATVLVTTANVPASAQQPQDSPQQTQAPAPQPDAQSTILHASTHLVVVDVSVQDKDGHPVHGLKPEDFHLTEGKVPQNLRHFEEHSALVPVPRGPELPQLPLGTFTDYTPVPPDSTLNILLLDALNTPTTDQNFVRYELQQYVKHADPGARIAIFGLANRLIMLQGFTSDPATLKNVVEHKLIARASPLLDDPTGSGVNQDSPADVLESTMAGPGATQLVANMQEFETDTANMQTQLRMQFTLDAFNTLAHYLASFPGRKNLIWFSGSFPLNILPDSTLADPFAVAHLNEDEYRETTNLLAKAQVAVFPIDARGLKVPPTYNAAASGRSYTSNPQKFSAALTSFYSSQAAEHTTMDTLASETGGKAYFNTNDLANAVGQAMDAGANYYTLTYSPINHKEDGSYREIRVNLGGIAPSHDLQLSYRHGYYADDAQRRDADSETATTSEEAVSAHGQTTAYQRAAMSRGAPTPQDLLFKARVLPASAAPENTVAPANTLDATISPKGPFRRYAVDYVALPSELTLSLQPDGRREGAIEFLVYVFDVDGRLLNATGKTVSLNLTPATYARMMNSAIECHLEISAPTGVETFLRVGVRDVPSNHLGVIEVPTASVSHLAPAVYQTPPSAKTPPAASAQPPSN
jgi:VWFA-related protein